MKVTNPDRGRVIDVTTGARSTAISGSKGMTWRDASTESQGQVYDMTVVGADFHDNEDGTGILTIGGTSGGGGGTDFLGSSGGEGGKEYTNAAAGSSLAINLASYNVFDITLTANLTISFTGTLNAGLALEWKIILRQGGSGGYTVTWPGALQWQDTDGTSGGPAPTLFTAVGAIDVIQVVSLDAGTTYGGADVSQVGGSSVSALDDLSDVTITTPAADQQLQYISGVWVNNSRRWEPVTFDPGTGPEIVFDSTDVVMTWKAY